MAANGGTARGRRTGATPRASLALALALSAALGSACAGSPAPPAAPDPDRAPDVAQPLVLGGEWHDAVECGAGDCADWFSLEIPGSGALELDLELSGPAEECAALRLALLDAVGVPLVKLAPQPGGAGGWQLRHRVRVRRGRYRLGVLASAARERVEYRLRASLAEVPVPDALPPTPRARPRR